MKKKSNFKTAALLLVLAISAVPVFGQSGQGQGRGDGQGQRQGQGQDQRQSQGQRRQMSEEDVKKNVADLATTLELTDKQEKQILEVDLDYYKTLQKERENYNPETSDRDAMRARMNELRDERNGKYKTVLTESQYTKFIKIQEERREKMRQRRGESEGQGSEGQRSRGRGGN